MSGFALNPKPGLETYAEAVGRARTMAAEQFTAARELGHDLHPWAAHSSARPWVLSTACSRCGRFALVDGLAEQTSGAALHDRCDGRRS